MGNAPVVEAEGLSVFSGSSPAKVIGGVAICSTNNWNKGEPFVELMGKAIDSFMNRDDKGPYLLVGLKPDPEGPITERFKLRLEPITQ